MGLSRLGGAPAPQFDDVVVGGALLVLHFADENRSTFFDFSASPEYVISVYGRCGHRCREIPWWFSRKALAVEQRTC